MARESKIEWCDDTWNPVRGCTRVSEGCKNCYAEVMAARFSQPGQWGHGFAEVVGTGARRDHRWTGRVELIESQLTLPLKWRKPRRIFVNSTSDLFHEDLPDAAIDRVFAVMALCPQHTFQVLTKRPERMRDYISGEKSPVPYLGRMPLERIHLEAAGHMEGDGGYMDALKRAGNVYSLYLDAPWPLPNIWLGTSVEDQATAEERIPHLLATPAAVRFCSAEPLLGPVDLIGTLARWQDNPNRDRRFVRLGAQLIGWVIVGGESGPHARPMHPDWARSLRDQCAAAGVPFFFKQWGAWLPTYQDEGEVISYGRHHRHGWNIDEVNERWAYRVGKARAGRLLDGREHNEFPAALEIADA